MLLMGWMMALHATLAAHVELHPREKGRAILAASAKGFSGTAVISIVKPEDIKPGLAPVDELDLAPASPIALRDVQLSGSGAFLGVEDGLPAGRGRVLMLSANEPSYASAFFSFFEVFTSCFFSASTCFEISSSSLFASTPARATLCAVRSALPMAAPIFFAAYFSRFFAISSSPQDCTGSIARSRAARSRFFSRLRGEAKTDRNRRKELGWSRAERAERSRCRRNTWMKTPHDHATVTGAR